MKVGLSSALENAYIGKYKKVYVLDASAFMIGGIEFHPGISYTTDSVVREVKANIIQKARLEGLIASKVLKVCSPDYMFIDLIKKKSIELGEETSLSDTDVEVLALALELSTKGLEVTLISDDYSVQNVAGLLGLKWMGIKYTGISRIVQWKMVCELCRHETYGTKIKTCPRCGVKMRRKPVIKKLKS